MRVVVAMRVIVAVRVRMGVIVGMPVRSGPPETAGRWAVLPDRDHDPTRRAHARAEHLLERHGVVTRGAVVSERVVGGFAGVYKVLSAFEDTGRCRRGYFIEGLGAAQFGTAGAIDRLRTFSEPESATGGGKATVVALAATDPANVFGAALPWPEPADSYAPLRTVVANGQPPLWPAQAGATYHVADEVTLTVLGPLAPLTGTRSDPNNNSVVLLATVRGVRVLLTGDAEEELQRTLLATHGPALRAEVLKVPHHGSAYQDHQFLAAVDPLIAMRSE